MIEGMADVFTTAMALFADTSAAVTVMRSYVTPTIQVLAVLASLACVFFIVNAGYLYMTSSGKPEQLDHAKHVLKNAALGLIIVLAAATLVSLLSGAYGSPHDVNNATLPNLQPIEPNNASSGLVDVLVKATVGFLDNILQTIATPFLSALEFFTKSTPLMAENQTVFNFWLAMVGITDVLLIIIIALLGFHVMSGSTFGFDEIEFKHLLPRLALVFLLMNTSIFFIDAIIELSNVLISAVNAVSGASSVWNTLSAVVDEAGAQSLAALLMMMVFLVLSVILLVYYVGRLVTLFIGAVLSPLVMLIWLIPGFRDFAETALKTYITTIFVLFVHVVILQIAASLLTGMSTINNNNAPNVFMAMIVGLATILALLKTQGMLMQFSYVSMGARNMRQLGGQFMNGVSYMSGKGWGLANTVRSKTDSAQKARAMAGVEKWATQSGQTRSMSFWNKKGDAEITYSVTPHKKAGSDGAKTGTTYEAPKVTATRTPASNTPKNNSKDKTI